MAKKQDAFRKIIKTFPGPDEVKQILNALDAESDRGVALIAAAFLENGLERY